MDWNEYSIEEIKEYLEKIEITEDLLVELEKDKRVGVKNLVKKYLRKLKLRKRKEEQWQLLNKRQLDLKNRGYNYVAGIDEAGRGPLAGPVVAAAVILDPDIKIIGLDDSKKLSEKERNRLFKIIKEKAVSYGIGIIDNNIIDQVNILNATFKAMVKAIGDLDYKPDYLLVDGNREVPNLTIKQEKVVDGDSRINSIAAASILAKVTRDRIITEYHKKYPEYNFVSNKGYGTKEHIDALKKYGPTPIHRLSFSVVQKYNFIKFKEKIARTETVSELQNIGKEIDKYSIFTEENLQVLREAYKNQYKKIK